MKTLTVTLEEILALQQLLHRANLHSGMEVADACVYWRNKLRDAPDLIPPVE